MTANKTEWHDGLWQISSHQVKQNIFSTQSQGHIASCPGDSVTHWLLVFHKPCFLCCRAFFWREKKTVQFHMKLSLMHVYSIWDRNSFNVTKLSRPSKLNRKCEWQPSNWHLLHHLWPRQKHGDGWALLHHCIIIITLALGWDVLFNCSIKKKQIWQTLCMIAHLL